MIPTVLFILHLPPPVHGASMVGKYIYDSKYINNRFDCHYINLTTAKDLSDIGKLNWQKLKLFMNLLLIIRETVKQLKPSLVYVTPNAKGSPFYKDFIVVQMLKAMGCKVVLHYHNKGVVKYQERIWDNFLYKCFFKDVKVILLANSLYDDIKKYIHQRDVYICPNGIPDASIKTKQENLKTQILYLSNLQKEKGVLEVLDACSILKVNGYDFNCNIIGSETFEISTDSIIEEINKRNLTDMVIYHGKKYGIEKESFYNQTDIFVFPTYYHNECFPLVLLEAMQHKIACISTNEGGISDIIEHGKTGFIVEKNNSEELAEKIAVLIQDDELRIKMGKVGYEKYKSEFTLEAFEKQFVDVLNEVLVS